MWTLSLRMDCPYGVFCLHCMPVTKTGKLGTLPPSPQPRYVTIVQLCLKGLLVWPIISMPFTMALPGLSCAVCHVCDALPAHAAQDAVLESLCALLKMCSSMQAFDAMWHHSCGRTLHSSSCFHACILSVCLDSDLLCPVCYRCSATAGTDPFLFKLQHQGAACVAF